MAFRRSSGVLLHPTSLPGGGGIGDLGPSAFAFVDKLAAARQRLWQVLPLGPTGYGDSPYQCFSAFAGNPLLVSPERLIESGLLAESDAGDLPPEPTPHSGSVDFPSVIAHRRRIWPTVRDRFDADGSTPMHDRFDRFCREQARWLDDYALFMAVKEAHAHAPWIEWEPDIARKDPSAVARWSAQCIAEIRMHKVVQFLFFEQWARLRDACHARDIEIMGDLPIFVAHDSADVWAHRELFQLDEHGTPTVLTGVPPDYFSADGQLWGNPHYRWDVLDETGYAWWIDRFRALLTLVDRIRVDHFRGFEASWEIPAGATTAVRGRWVKGPGASLFEAVRRALKLDHLPLVAENLGVITPEVETLRQRFDLPGMAILQFGFGTDPQAPTFRPHNYRRDLVVYTGTHDNDTIVGWWTGGSGHSTRSEVEIADERDYAQRYLDLDGDEVHWAFVRAVLASVAETAIIPVPDLLGLGSEARLNRPGIASGNWRWRMREGELTAEVLQRLAMLTETYERT
ncbi:MAG TPA: 4-alpha-glucanotransferase [Vicinamibacterales bacterium]|nr:4-alpha-glucanotransferase [Vicinamibacterales bacterium]